MFVRGVSCAKGKAQQKSLPKDGPHQVATTDNERRIFIDITTIEKKDGKVPIYKSSWRIMVDEKTLAIEMGRRGRYGLVDFCELGRI